MSQFSKLKEEIVSSNDLKMLTQAYQEHAIEQINFARYSVLSSREFAEELEEIFYNVKTSYRSAMLEMMKSRHTKFNPLLTAKKQKEVLVLITANNILYGDIILKIFRNFYDRARNTNADIVVIGKLGKRMFEASELHKPYMYFEIPDSKISFPILQPLIHALMPYEKVTVFHGKFNNIISQDAIAESLSGDLSDRSGDLSERSADLSKSSGDLPDRENKSPDSPNQNISNNQEIDFLFEPSLENIVQFFETQIFSLLLSQSIHEAQLARYASRVQAMESARNKMEKWIDSLIKQERKLKALEINKKQMQLFAGRKLWGKRVK